MSTRAIQLELLLGGILDPNTSEPIASGTVYFYEAGTTTAKNVWTEKEKTNAYTYYELDATGTAQLYGDGIYKIVVKNSDGATIYTWDNIKIRAHNYSVVTKIADYTLTADDDVVLVNTTSGDVTITFLPSADMEYPVTIVHTTGSNDIILTPDGSETIDGDATYTFSETNASVVVFADGSNLRKANLKALGLYDAATITLANSGLHILDTDDSHDLIITPGSNLTADRILTITTGDAARTITLSGDLTVDEDFQVTTDTFTSGTIMLFGQNSAPTGWTRKTDWQDNAMLCYASAGDIASGGAANPQSTHTHASVHTHQWYNYIGLDSSFKSYNSGGSSYTVPVSGSASDGYHLGMLGVGDTVIAADLYTDWNAVATAANSAPYFQEVIACTKD